jgi:hypothetical protein
MMLWLDLAPGYGVSFGSCIHRASKRQKVLFRSPGAGLQAFGPYSLGKLHGVQTYKNDTYFVFAYLSPPPLLEWSYGCTLNYQLTRLGHIL